jgi:hypothetical protein
MEWGLLRISWSYNPQLHLTKLNFDSSSCLVDVDWHYLALKNIHSQLKLNESTVRSAYVQTGQYRLIIRLYRKWKEQVQLTITKPTPSRILSPAIFYYYTTNLPAVIWTSALNFGWYISNQIVLVLLVRVRFLSKSYTIYNLSVRSTFIRYKRPEFVSA